MCKFSTSDTLKYLEFIIFAMMQRLWTTIVKCVRYDVEFQQRLAEEMQNWEAAGQPKRTRADVAGE